MNEHYIHYLLCLFDRKAYYMHDLAFSPNGDYFETTRSSPRIDLFKKAIVIVRIVGRCSTRVYIYAK